ncbi:MAG TPA: helix-turn-helix domain-containing protein [Pyrinomonadaceae bacterium]|jgi:hypothetical protein
MSNKDEKEKSAHNEKKEKFVKVSALLFNQGRYLTTQAKWVYATLRSFTNNETDLTFPSYNKIQERSNLNRVAVANALEELEKFHWIKRENRFKQTNNYIMSPPIRRNADGTEAEDQTCPTKEEAAKWKNNLRNKRNPTGRKVLFITQKTEQSNNPESKDGEKIFYIKEDDNDEPF